MPFNDDMPELNGGKEEEIKLAVSTFTVRNDFGEKVILQKEHPAEETAYQLYIMAIDRTIHGTYLGYDAFNRRHFKFYLDLEFEAISDVIAEFTDAGWPITWDSADMELE